MLPEELHDYLPDFYRKGQLRWEKIPEAYWPGILVVARDNYWKAVRSGEDQSQIDVWLNPDEIGQLISYLLRDPESVLAILCVTQSHNDLLSQFYANIMTASNEILALSNKQEGELDNKLIATKQRIVAQIKTLVDSMSKWKDVRPKGGVKKLSHSGANGRINDISLAPDKDFFDPSSVTPADFTELKE